MEQSNTQPGIDWAGKLERLQLTLEAMDPDWLRLTQSLKTVLAVMLTLAIIYPLAPGDVFLSAVGAGFLMQCGEGANRRRQQITLIIFGLAVILLAVLGAAANSHREAKEVLVIVVAFLTFYLRRFVTRRPGFTAFGFVVCLLATVLPGGRQQAVSHTEALAVALLVAFVVFFYLRPPNPLRALAVSTRVFCRSVADLLRALGGQSDARTVAKFEHLVKGRGLHYSQALSDNMVPGPETKLTDELLLGQYDAWQTLQMLEDSLGRLTAADAERLPVVWSALLAALEVVATSFERPLTPEPEGGVTTSSQSMTGLQIELLRSGGQPDRSWVYFGGIILAGRRLDAQASRLAGSLKSRSGRRQGMNLDLGPTTRLAIRAAAVATAAVLVARLSFLERPYWIVLTAVLLVYETAGESIKRSGQRLAMTALGCLTGWGLYLVAAPVPGLRWTILLGGIFLARFFRSNPRGVVYAPMIFFASVYVVFVFAVVDSWTVRLMLTRLYDTAIGCVRGRWSVRW